MRNLNRNKGTIMKHFTKILVWALAALLVVAVVFMVSCKKSSTAPKDTGSWTVMVYGAGNNNLDTLNNTTSYIIQDVQDMEKVGTQPGLNIIAMVASLSMGGQAKYYKIEYKPNDNVGQLTSQVLDNLGTRDMSDGTTLKNFINYCKGHYPATHYLLVIDDHGGGWQGTCSDDMNGGGGLLTMEELRQAISTSDLQHVDVITFHACLMAALESAYELRNVASYMTACQFSMPMENVLGADLWLGWMKDNRTAAPLDVARKVAEKVIERATFKQKTTQYGVIDLSQVETLGSLVGHFGTELINNSGNYWNEVVQSWGTTHTTALDDQSCVDLREFANHVMNSTHLQGINLIDSAAVKVISAVNAAVPYTGAHFEPPQGTIPRGGLNVYLPFQATQYDSTRYRQLQFDATGWHNFISAFLPNTGGQDPTGRCCYGNQQCAVNTNAACTGLAGQWQTGLDCTGNPCQQQATCPLTCANAQAVNLGQTYNCSLTGADSINWFSVSLPAQANYEFRLCGFTYQPNDFDLYVINNCTNLQILTSSLNYGCEDTVWQASGNLILAVVRAVGGGSYSLTVSQHGVPQATIPVSIPHAVALADRKSFAVTPKQAR